MFKDLTQIRYLEEEMRRREWLANLGEMSAGMAHEIRNPLGALAGAMQMLRQDVGPDETSQRLMDIAIREAKRLDNIITGFLQYARPPALNLSEHDLNKVLADTLDLIQHEARSRKGITIIPKMASGTLTAQIDHDQLRQVFWNLAVNAFDAMCGGGTLTITTGLRRVEVGGCRSDVIEIGFQDGGEGFPNRISTKSFFRFLPPKKKGPGWVWPKSTASWICTAGGSKSKVTSEPGHGLLCVYRSPSRPVCGCGMKEGNRGKDFSRR